MRSVDKGLFRTAEILCAASGIFFSLTTLGLNLTLYQGFYSDLVSIICYIIMFLVVLYPILLQFKREKRYIEWGVLSLLITFPICMWLGVGIFGPYAHSSSFSLISIIVVFIATISNAWWISRLIRGLNKIFKTRELRDKIYRNAGEFYIFKRGSQEIPMGCVGISLNLSISALAKTLPIYLVFLSFAYFKGELTFVQLFLSALSLPLAMLLNGLFVYCFFVYLYYPSILKREEGKEVIYQF